MIKINICSDFSDTPGGRLIREGAYSGEEFRDTLLISKYLEAEKQNDILEINFDGCYGFGTSFLEEAFGGMVRKHHKHGTLQRMRFISTEDETIPDNIKKYVKEAEEKDR
jgi:hypothetical protein